MGIQSTARSLRIMISGINHITFCVSDLDRSLAFYTDVLGFRAHVRWDSGAYLSQATIWLCLNLGNPAPARDYSHIAWSVSSADFATMAQHIQQSGAKLWQNNQSEEDSLYFLDPDGHQLEIHAGGLEQRLDHLETSPYQGLRWLEP